MKRRDIAFGASGGFAVAGIAMLGWGIYISVKYGSSLRFAPHELVVGGLGVVSTLLSFIASLYGIVVPIRATTLGLTAAALLGYHGSIPVDGFIKEGFLWVASGVLTVTLATLCQVAARTGDGPPVDSQANSPLRHPTLWLAAAASVTVAATITQLLVLHTSPLRVQQAAEIADLPQLPRTVQGEVAWVTSIPGDISDNAAGSRGPIIAMSDGVVGIDSSDGSIVWQRRRTGGYLCPWTNARHAGDNLSFRANNYLIISPNRRYVAYATCEHRRTTSYEVLDTVTGALVLEGTTQHEPIGQLTDEVFWVGEQAISLSEGKVLWEEKATSSMPATSSKFVTIQECSLARYEHVCTVATRDHNDPSNYQTFDDVIIDDELTYRSTLVQGWVAQFVPGTEPPSEAIDVPMQALNLATGETVPLGEFNYTRNISATQLVLQSADGTLATFDPMSQTVTHLDLPAHVELADEDLPLPEVYGTDWDISKFSRYARSMRVHIADREVTIPMEVPAGVADHWQRMGLNIQAWLAPDCLIVQGLTRTYEEAGKDNGNQVHVACLR